MDADGRGWGDLLFDLPSDSPGDVQMFCVRIYPQINAD